MLECAYVAEWVGDDDGAWVDRRRHPGSLVVAVPFAPAGVAIVDIPMTPAAHFSADPALWDATRFTMVTRRRAAAPCIALEEPGTSMWITNGLLGALQNQAFMANLLPEAECTFTSDHAWARLSLSVAHYAEEARLRLLEEEDALLMSLRPARDIERTVVTTGIPVGV